MDELRQLLKIPRPLKYYHVTKELLRALTSSMLLSLERANAWALLFARLIATLCFFLKSFYLFFNRIARYAQSKESRNLLRKIPQITCKAIFRSCLKFSIFIHFHSDMKFSIFIIRYNSYKR